MKSSAVDVVEKHRTRGTSAEKLSPPAQLQGYLASGRATCAEIYSSCENESLLVGEKARARPHFTKSPSFRHVTFGFRVMRANEPRNRRERFASVSIAKARRHCNIFFQSESRSEDSKAFGFRWLTHMSWWWLYHTSFQVSWPLSSQSSRTLFLQEWLDERVDANMYSDAVAFLLYYLYDE